MLHWQPFVRRTCTGYLKKVVLFELFEHAPLYFNKLVRHEKCKERMIVRVDRNVEGNGLIHHHEGVDD